MFTTVSTSRIFFVVVVVVRNKGELKIKHPFPWHGRRPPTHSCIWGFPAEPLCLHMQGRNFPESGFRFLVRPFHIPMQIRDVCSCNKYLSMWRRRKYRPNTRLHCKLEGLACAILTWHASKSSSRIICKGTVNYFWRIACYCRKGEASSNPRNYRRGLSFHSGPIIGTFHLQH